MTGKKIETLPVDGEGRRRIKDRRFRVAAKLTPEQRAGLKRRSGWDRRYKQILLVKGANRREGGCYIGIFSD
jgi:hypothetical protein